VFSVSEPTAFTAPFGLFWILFTSQKRKKNVIDPRGYAYTAEGLVTVLNRLPAVYHDPAEAFSKSEATKCGDGAVDPGPLCERHGFESTVRHECVPEQDT